MHIVNQACVCLMNTLVNAGINRDIIESVDIFWVDMSCAQNTVLPTTFEYYLEDSYGLKWDYFEDSEVKFFTLKEKTVLSVQANISQLEKEKYPAFRRLCGPPCRGGFGVRGPDMVGRFSPMTIQVTLFCISHLAESNHRTDTGSILMPHHDIQYFLSSKFP